LRLGPVPDCLGNVSDAPGNWKSRSYVFLKVYRV
jgi:hypothetical protein